MVYKKAMKKGAKAGMGMMATGVGLGYGMEAMGSLGLTGTAGTAISQTTAGVAKITGKMPVVGGIVGARMVMDVVDDLHKPYQKMTKKKRR